MATSPPLSIILQHGLVSHKVELGQDWKVKDLHQHVWSSFSIPVDRQKIIYKGRILSDPEATIHSINFKPKSKLMLIGEAVVLSGEQRKLLLDIGDILTEQSSKFSALQVTINEVLVNGFLPKTLQPSATVDYLKSLRVISGQCTNMIDRLDSIQVSPLDTAYREKRKSLIDRINKMLDEVDACTTRLNPPQSDK